MIPQPLTITPATNVANGTPTSVILVFKENLRHRVGGVVVGVAGGTTDPTGITDDQNNLYTLVTSANASGASRSSIWYCQKVLGCPQKLTIKWSANSSQTTVTALFTDQPLLNTASATNAANTTALAVGPLTTMKSGEELVVGVCISSNLNATFPAGFVVLNQGATTGSFGYAFPPKRAATWNNTSSVICTACLASFKAVPVATLQWAFDPITKFSGVIPPPAANASWSDTLTWTYTHTATEVEASYSDTVTWTPTIPPPGDDDFIVDTLTWSDSYVLASTDVTLADTLTWTGTNVLAGVDTPPLADTLTHSGTFETVPDIETALSNLLIWSDEFDQDMLIQNTVTWLDLFYFDGEVFPPIAASWSDTLTWDMQPIQSWDWNDTLTWSDEFALAELTATFADTLTWSAVTGADPNLLGAARYRR